MKYSGIILLTMMVAVFCVQAGVAEPQRDQQEQNRLNQKLIAKACGFGFLSIKDLVEQGADIHAVDSRGCSVLHAAARWGRLEVAEFLVERGANIHALADGGWSALHCAVERGNLEFVQFLVKSEANIHALTGKGQSVINCAARGGNFDSQDQKMECSKIMQFLAQQGATISPEDEKAKIADVLLKAIEGVSSDQFAALCEKPESLLITKYDKLNNAQKTNLLRCAALAGSDNLVNALLANGVTVDEECALSLSPRACAVIGNLQPRTFDRIPTQGVYGDDERVYALAKRHEYHYGKNKLMTLLSIAIAAVLRMVDR